MPAQCSWSPVRLFGPGYPAPALRTVSPIRQENPVWPVPASRTCRAKVGMQPKREVDVVSTTARFDLCLRSVVMG